MTSPATSSNSQARSISVRHALSILLQSISQIFFRSHWLGGLLILTAFASYNLAMAALVLLGAATASASALLSGIDKRSVQLGTHGFCGALVGAAAFASLGGTGAAAMVALVGGIATIPVTLALTALFNLPPLRRFQLPYTTAPFCLISGLMLVLTTDFSIEEIQELDHDGPLLPLFAHAVMTDISEVVLMDSALAGFIILVGLFLMHWKMGLAALLGGAVESGAALLLGEPRAQIYHGVAGYSGVLVAIALATVFIVGTWKPWLVALAGLLLLIPIGTLLGLTDLPLYTWPYVITTWVVLIIVRFIPGLQRAA